MSIIPVAEEWAGMWLRIGQRHDIVARLAEIYPIYEYGCGDAGCFFCESTTEYREWPRTHIHEPDCIWLLANNLQRKAPNAT